MIDACKILVYPNGLHPVLNGVVTVQEDLSLDGFPGLKANRQNVKSRGKPKGSPHVTRLSMIADPPVVLHIHPYLRWKVDLYWIDIDEKENLLLQVSYPRSKVDYKTVNSQEVNVILV